MTIYFLTLNDTGTIQVGFKVNGTRYLGLLWSQGGKMYVRTGSKRDGDLQRHWLSDSQQKKCAAFIESAANNVEWWEGIA